MKKIDNNPFSFESYLLRDAQRIVAEICERREHKIANSVVMNVQRSYKIFKDSTGDGKPQIPSNLTPEEQELYREPVSYTHLEIEITGETHTLCNALRKTLMEDKDVEAAAYVIEHPIIGEPKLYIKAKNPKKSLQNAAEIIKSRCEEFKELIESDADGKTKKPVKSAKTTKKSAKKTSCLLYTSNCFKKYLKLFHSMQTLMWIKLCAWKPWEYT